MKIPIRHKLVDPFLEENPDDIGLLCVFKKAYEKSDNEESAVYYEEMLKEYRQNIVYFLLDNNNSIRVDDLKIYEPVYKCYRQKGNCLIWGIVLFEVDYQILFVLIVAIIIMIKRFSYVLTIGNNMKWRTIRTYKINHNIYKINLFDSNIP